MGQEVLKQSMNIYEIYALAGENATDVVNRFGSEVVVEKFALRFLDDPSYENLASALSAGDTQTAFRAAHTLKGIAANLGFNNLYVAASRLTEKLRGNENADTYAEFNDVRAEYAKVVAAIKRIK